MNNQQEAAKEMSNEEFEQAVLAGMAETRERLAALTQTCDKINNRFKTMLLEIDRA